jgi:Ran GTPase-activating protein (RanGAP) involved in mRNA processing and transport
MDVYRGACADRKVKSNAGILELSPTTHSIDLSRNYLGSENGFAAFLEFVAKNERLQELNLTDCHLTTENVEALTEVCLKHPSITTLRLHANRLFVESGTHLVRLARFNPNVTTIEVRDDGGTPRANHIPDRLLRKLDAHLAYNQRTPPGRGV